MSQTRIVAIDGPAGSGKSTVARAVAARLRYVYVDTGAIYRALALAARRRGLDVRRDEGLDALAQSLAIAFVPTPGGQRVLLDGEDVSEAIRTPEISLDASAVSGHASVRQALLGLQRRLATADGTAGAVLEGRDIGTVVFPHADLKVFLSASEEERARRRHLQLRAAGAGVSLPDVLREQRQRDHDDSTRAVAPLRQAADAELVDTTALEIEQVVARIVALAQAGAVPRHADD